MANSYKKVYLHIVFAVKNRNALLNKAWRSRLFAYISGIIKEKGHYPLAVNGHKDHVHIFLDYNLHELVSDLVREIKKSSTKYIKSNKLTQYKFEWQSGYGVFSVGFKDIDTTIKYIIDQEEHHRKTTFKAEYLKVLNEFKIEFKEEYLFDFIV